MIAILSFINLIIRHIVDLLDTRLFSDINVTYLEIILGSVVTVFIFKLIFGGFKEMDTQTNFFARDISRNVSKQISNIDRINQINSNYEPRHAYNEHSKK